MPTASQPLWISVKNAARKAIDYLHELIPQIPVEDISLEEVEPSGNDQWLVTLGFTDPHAPASARLYAESSNRAYKLFRIDAITGEVISMTIRKP